MVAMAHEPKLPSNRPGRTPPLKDFPVKLFMARMLWLWVIGALGIGLLYLLIARVMTPTHQEDMAQTQVFAYRGWQSSGIRLQTNERALIRAEGYWLYTPGEWHDANGHRRYSAPSFYPMTGVPGGGLLARVGNDGLIQHMGARGELWANEPGMIYFRINDDILTDNEGALNVSIEVIPAPVAK